MSPCLHRLSTLIWPTDHPARHRDVAAVLTALDAATTPPPPGTRSDDAVLARHLDAPRERNRSWS